MAQRVGAELDLPVTVDSDPKAVVAIGAALSVSPRFAEFAEFAEVAEVAELPTVRTPVAMLEPLPQLRARARRRVMPALIGVALGVGVLLVVWAGMVGTDVLPNGGADTGEGLAAPAAEGESGGVTEDGTDPWTGKPYTEDDPARPDPAGCRARRGEPGRADPRPDEHQEPRVAHQGREASAAGTRPVAATTAHRRPVARRTRNPPPAPSADRMDPTTDDPPPTDDGGSAAADDGGTAAGHDDGGSAGTDPTPTPSATPIPAADPPAGDA